LCGGVWKYEIFQRFLLLLAVLVLEEKIMPWEKSAMKILIFHSFFSLFPICSTLYKNTHAAAAAASYLYSVLSAVTLLSDSTSKRKTKYKYYLSVCLLLVSVCAHFHETVHQI
jgi:hypothetical protein